MGLEHPLSRYASRYMLRLWSPQWNVRVERQLWLAIADWMYHNTSVYDHEQDVADRLMSYRDALSHVRLDRIKRREWTTKHDLKARIEEFNAVAFNRRRNPDWGPQEFELIHWGMTSADVVDNISLIRMRKALLWLHNLAAHGAPFSSIMALRRELTHLPFRGIKGPIGTGADMASLIGESACRELDEYLASVYGFTKTLDCVGQMYHRSLDLGPVTAAVWATAGKQPWHVIGAGYLRMVAEYSGDTWNEGDVSTSVVRRVALPGVFMVADAALRGVDPRGGGDLVLP